jgi:hypothetical protein
MRKCLIALSVLAGLVAVGCSTAKTRPTGAGSTPVLRLMRDWRGVWTGHVRDSPMGQMTYTLYVEAAGGELVLSSAPMKEPGLDSIRHSYRLIHFEKGNPLIEYSLAQRGKTVEGTVAYREDLSNDDEAVFCPEDKGCDRVRFSVALSGDKAVLVKTRVDEARHADFDLAFASREIPTNHGEWLDRPVPGSDKPKNPKTRVDEDGNPLDQDTVLKDHVDDDVGTTKKKDAPKEKKKDKSGDEEFDR